jgi:hypothetical protein
MRAWLSCEDENTIESQITRCSKTAMATVRQSLVCGVYNVDYWEFAEGWHKYVPKLSPLLKGRC